MKIKAILLFLTLSVTLSAQTNSRSIFKSVAIRVDTTTWNNQVHTVVSEDERMLYFVYDNEDEFAEITLIPSSDDILMLQLIPSADYEVVDSLVFSAGAWHTKIRFRNLTKSQFLKLQFGYGQSDSRNYEIVRLLPCTRTSATFKPSGDELYIGEEKTFEIVTNNSANLRFSPDWTSGERIDSRIERQNDRVILHVMPNVPGTHKFRLMLQTDKPDIGPGGQITRNLPPLEYTFNVRNIRLQYLNTDKKDITMDEKSRTQGMEIQIDNSRALKINKTYRVENQELPGGVLVAEIYTRSYLSDNRVLCYLKTYNYHRAEEGYLYIKDGDDALFITNFNITPVTSISGLSVMRDGGEWMRDPSVYPGETVSVKIEGTALYKARFHFEDVQDITSDTLLRNENEVVMKIKIPLDIGRKRIGLYNNSMYTGQGLTVKEYEIPRPFDYIMVNYGDINRTVSGIHGPVLYDKTIRDIVISFNPDRIDNRDKLYGRQHVTIDLRVTGPSNELIDIKTLPQVTVCPADNSPRYRYYDRRNCNQGEISLNKFLRRNTSELDDWSRVNLTFKSTPGRYNEEGQVKEVEIILKKRTKFDIDVSFPAGLVTVSKDDEVGKTTFSNLYGISMAMVAQFSFYHPEKIAKVRPYRFGAGFLALDAFNFQSERQDLALVALASLYPTTRDKKLAFPLYIGGGYQFKAEKWMLLIGPGISVKL